MEGKDAAIGFLLIGIIAVAGGMGYIYLNPTCPEEDCEKCDDCSECPECPEIPEDPEPDTDERWPDWGDANNDTVILTLFNGTTIQTITLGEILDYINKWNSTKIEKYWWEKRIEAFTVTDPYTELPVKGVSLFDVIQVLDTNYAGSFECAGKPYGPYG